MFNSLKVFAVAAGLVGAVLASNVHARGFGRGGNGGGGSRIRSSNFSATQGNGNSKRLLNPQKPMQLNSVKPAITPSKLGNFQTTNKLVSLGNGNQFSKGKNINPNKSGANKGPNVKKQKYAKYSKWYFGYGPWNRLRDWGFWGDDGWDCGYDDFCGDDCAPECSSCGSTPPAADGDPSGQDDPSGNE